EDTWDIATVEADTRILRKVRGAGEAVSIYGVVNSRRDGDRWRHRFQTDASSRPVLGRPLSDYGPGALIEGSPEAEALLVQVAQQAREREIALESERAAAAAAQKAAEAERTAQRKRIEEAVARHGAEFMPTTLNEYRSDRHTGRSFVFLAQDVSI